MPLNYSPKHDAYIADNADTMSDKQIGMRLGRSALGIKKRRERLGIFKETGSDSINRFNLKNSKRLEAIGLLNYIQYGKHKEVAEKRLLELNIESFGLVAKSSREKVPLKIKAKAFTMHSMGMGTPDIASEIGVSTRSVWRWIESFKPYTGKNSIMLTIRSKV